MLLNSNQVSIVDETADAATVVINTLDARFKKVGASYKTWSEFFHKHIDRELCSFEEFQNIRY